MLRILWAAVYAVLGGTLARILLGNTASRFAAYQDAVDDFLRPND